MVYEVFVGIYFDSGLETRFESTHFQCSMSIIFLQSCANNTYLILFDVAARAQLSKLEMKQEI